MNYDRITLIPYEELECKIEGQNISLSTPWIAVNGELDPEGLEFAHYCAANLRNPRNQGPISRFLKPFQTYPIAYWSSGETENERFRPFLLTRLRRNRLLENAKMPSSFERKPAEALKMAVRQNLHITTQCDSILAEAIQCFPAVTGGLSAYRKEERGHDRLIARSVELLGASGFPVLPETEKILEVFQKSIGVSFLAFCACLDFFEGIRFSSAKSPLATEVEKHFCEEAARPLQAHYSINREHEHDQIALSLLASDPVGLAGEFEEASSVVRDLMAADRALRREVFTQ